MTAPRDLRVSLIQAETLWHEPARNRQRYGALVRTLASATDLVVLPETFTSGFSNEALASAEGMDGPTVEWMSSLAADVGAVITGSIQCRVNDRVYNRLIWARPDGSVEHYDKRHLFRMANEHHRYAAGQSRITLELHGWRVRPLVCYDLRFPVFVRNVFDESAQRFEYDLVLFVANWPAARRYAWRSLLVARAIENLSYCVGVNRVGTDANGITYAGDSAALDMLGQPLVECGSQPQVVTVTLSSNELREHRERFPAQLDADKFTLID